MSSGRGGKRGRGAARGSQEQRGASQSQSKGTVPKESVESKLSDQLARTTLKEKGAEFTPLETGEFQPTIPVVKGAETMSQGGATKYESTTKPHDSPKQKPKEKIPAAFHNPPLVVKGCEVKYQGAATKHDTAPKPHDSPHQTKELQLHPSPGYIPPNRPGYGTLGRALTVLINFFPIKVPNITIHQYDVKIYNVNPDGDASDNDVTNRYVCRMVISALCTQALKYAYPAYDGRAIMYSKEKIGGRYPVEWLEPDTDVSDRKRLHHVELTYAACVDLSLITAITRREKQFECKSSHDDFLDKHQAATNALDAIFRQFGAAIYTPVGRSLYRSSIFDLGTGIELWEGFFQSARPGSNQVYLNVDMSYRSFYQPIMLMDYLSQFFRVRNKRELPSILSQDYARSKASREITSLEVFPIHLKYNRKYKIKYKPHEVFLNPANVESFVCEGQKITVQKYFLTEYEYQLEFPNLPCVNVGRGDKVVALPLEVCKIKRGQVKTDELNTFQKQKMIEATAVHPADRCRNIEDVAYAVLPPKDPLRAYYQIETSDRMAEAECRELTPPDIQYRQKTIKEQMGKWQIKDCHLFTPIPLDLWAIAHISRYGDEVQYEYLISELQKQAKFKGLQMSRATNERDVRNYWTNLKGGIDDVHRLIHRIHQTYPGLQMILCIIDRDLQGQKGQKFNSDDIYNHIKLIGDSELNILTQCIDQKNASRVNGATLGGVCLKINAKLGGTNHYATVRETDTLLNGTMVMGADVNHPKPGPDMLDAPSIAVACVALDRYITQYYSTCRFQVNRDEAKHRQEIILEFESMCEDLLSQYIRANARPQKILFYRDGVSESQFQYALNHELAALKRACHRIAKDFNPKITLVCVQKRHHMRMFEVTRDNRIYNVNPGTYLDTVITHPYEYDFYLCSHAALKGTARATHYHVLQDEIGYKPNLLYTITNQLCYCFSRCTKSVSIPPPVYYADLIAYRYHKYFDAYRRNNKVVIGSDKMKINWDFYRREVDAKIAPGKMFWA